MAKRKNKKADKPEFTGRIIFDGNLQLRIPGHGIKTIRTDLAGLKLHKADPNKELLVLTNPFAGYDELHTGYIVRTKNYDDQERPCFGLKHEPDADKKLDEYAARKMTPPDHGNQPCELSSWTIS